MYAVVPRPHKPQNIQTINIFFHPKVFEHLTSAIEKIFVLILNPKVKQKWIASSNLMLPKSKLGYSSQEEYLKTTSLKSFDILKNTITYVYPHFSSIDLQFLVKEFSIFTQKAHIVIVNVNQTSIVMYREIYLMLLYIKQIRAVIDKNKKLRSSNYHGIKKNSKPKALLKSLQNYLKERLNHPYFPIVNNEERERIQLQIAYIEKALNNEYKIFYDLFNFANIIVGLDFSLLRLSKNDQITIHQLLSLFNGIKSSDEELVMSCMIYMRLLSNIVDQSNYKILGQSILNIAIHFFSDIYIKGQVKRTRRGNHFTYNEKYVDKECRIKTFIDQVPIFSFKGESDFDFFKEMMEIVFSSFQGERNIFQPELPLSNPNNYFQLLRNIVLIKKDFNFTKEEIYSILSFLELVGIS